MKLTVRERSVTLRFDSLEYQDYFLYAGRLYQKLPSNQAFSFSGGTVVTVGAVEAVERVLIAEIIVEKA